MVCVWNDSSACVCKNSGTTSYKKSLFEVTPMLLYELVSLVRSGLCSKWSLYEVTWHRSKLFQMSELRASDTWAEMSDHPLAVPSPRIRTPLNVLCVGHLCPPFLIAQGAFAHILHNRCNYNIDEGSICMNNLLCYTSNSFSKSLPDHFCL